MKPDNKIVVFIDGGARGNPGPASCGVYIESLNKSYSEYLGEATNNEAEYQAAIFALKKLKKLIGKKSAKETEVEIKTDSELLYKQITHQYKIKESNLIPLFIELWNLMIDFGKVSFVKIPRQQNKIADKLVNQELDKKSQSLF